MSLASRPRPGVGAPIVPEDAVDPPVLPADPPLDVHLEDGEVNPVVVPLDGVVDDPIDPPPAANGFIHPAHFQPAAPSVRSERSRASYPREDGDGSESRSSHMPGRRMLPHADALAPILAAHQLPLVDSLTADLARETAGREVFSPFGEEDMRTAALTLVRYRLSTMAIIRQTDRGARRMFISDLRELERKAFPEMQLPHTTP